MPEALLSDDIRQFLFVDTNENSDDLSELAKSLLSLGEPHDVLKIFKHPKLVATAYWTDATEEEKAAIYEKTANDINFSLSTVPSVRLKILLLEIKLSLECKRNILFFIPNWCNFRRQFARTIRDLKNKEEILADLQQSLSDAVEGPTYPISELWEQVENG